MNEELTGNEPKRRPIDLAVRKWAEAAADRLFTNGIGDVADRLVLVTKDNRDLGGLCRSAVVDRLIEMLGGKP